MRVGEGNREATPCTSDVSGRCSDYISSGLGICALDFCPTCGQLAHYCDLTCGFLCEESGVTGTELLVLAPGATCTEECHNTNVGMRQLMGQVVAVQDTVAADKGLAFTAAATGTFKVRVRATEGSGSVTVVGKAIGTALERSAVLLVDGAPHPLSVSCHLTSCGFRYDGSTIYDSDESGFDLVMQNVEVSLVLDRYPCPHSECR